MRVLFTSNNQKQLYTTVLFIRYYCLGGCVNFQVGLLFMGGGFNITQHYWIVFPLQKMNSKVKYLQEALAKPVHPDEADQGKVYI